MTGAVQGELVLSVTALTLLVLHRDPEHMESLLVFCRVPGRCPQPPVLTGGLHLPAVVYPDGDPEYGGPAEDEQPGVCGGGEPVCWLPVPSTAACPGRPGDQNHRPPLRAGQVHVQPGQEAVVQRQHAVVAVILPVCQLGLS